MPVQCRPKRTRKSVPANGIFCKVDAYSVGVKQRTSPVFRKQCILFNCFVKLLSFQIYERIKSEPDSFDQTPLWYEIYNKHRNNTIIFGSNRDYLLLRDQHSQTIVTIFAYIILWWFSGVLSFSWKFVIYLIIMTACLNIGTRVQGKKMVYNVLSIDVNESVLEDRTKNDKQNI